MKWHRKSQAKQSHKFPHPQPFNPATTLPPPAQIAAAKGVGLRVWGLDRLAWTLVAEEISSSTDRHVRNSLRLMDICWGEAGAFGGVALGTLWHVRMFWV